MEDGALGAQGRKVRCASCGHAWFSGPDGNPAEAPSAEPPKPTGPTRADIERARRAEVRPHDQMRARIQASNRKAANAAATRSYIAAGILFVCAIGASIAYRQTIVEAWPKTASAYAMVGMRVNAYGLDYFNVKAARGFQGETPVLKVRGEVRNISKRARAAPDVRIALRDKKGVEIHAWKAQVDALIIGPGEGAPFSSYLANPPSAGYDIAISFATETASGSRKPADAAPHPAPADLHAEEAHPEEQLSSGDMTVPDESALTPPEGAEPPVVAPADEHGDDHHG
jgi:hypothetical protein